MDQAIVIHPVFPSGRRIIAVSDIHGNLPFFTALMEKIRLTPEDILILLGDMLEKGRDSLPLLRQLMELSKTHTVYPVCGNCDGLVLRFFETDELDSRFFSSYLPRHPESTLRQLAREGGFEQWDDLPRLRRDLRAAFPGEWAWLKAMPTILETEHLVFVHGGVPSLERMEELDRWGCMKNDNFLGQGHAFDKWVIVGHWPVTLYNPHIPSSAPLILRDRKIISIDGACVLKADGQLNALLFPSEDSENFSWTAWDGLPRARALDPQEAGADSVNIRWGRSGEGGGAVSVPPPGDGAGAVYSQRLPSPGPPRPGVRGLHRLPSAGVPRGAFDGGERDQRRFFVQKTGGYGLVLWAVVGYNGIKHRFLHQLGRGRHGTKDLNVCWIFTLFSCLTCPGCAPSSATAAAASATPPPAPS